MPTRFLIYGSRRCRCVIRLIIIVAMVYGTALLLGNIERATDCNPSSGCYCTWNDTILIRDRSNYDMKLCYKGVMPKAFQPSPASINEMSIRINGSNRSLTFEELADIPDNEWKKPIDAAVYELYPLTSPIDDTIKRVLSDSVLVEVNILTLLLFPKIWNLSGNSNLTVVHFCSLFIRNYFRIMSLNDGI